MNKKGNPRKIKITKKCSLLMFSISGSKNKAYPKVWIL